jgi:hypothetical protein
MCARKGRLTRIDRARADICSHAFNADIHIAFALGQVGNLVRPINHHGCHGLRLSIVKDVEDRLDAHSANRPRGV